MANPQIPILNFSEEELGFDYEVFSSQSGVAQMTCNERWKQMCTKVREACEREGCFFLLCDKIPTRLREGMFVATKQLYDLPDETKTKYVNPKPYRSYMGKDSVVPLMESLGVDNAHTFDCAKEFTNLMWPDGNPFFCKVFNTMSLKMLELYFAIMRMIMESFGLRRLYDSHVEENVGVFRVIKYKPSDHSAIALPAHTDKNGITILCQNEVQGLELQTRDGNWAQVDIPPHAFTVIVGDSVKAWSNGRLHAPRHRVVIKGDKDRYCFGLFATPKDKTIIQVPEDLVDINHPLLYSPFNFSDYVLYFMSNPVDDALETYAAISTIAN